MYTADIFKPRHNPDTRQVILGYKRPPRDSRKEMERISGSVQSLYLEGGQGGEGLSKCQWGGRFVEESRPILDRRSPHSITSYQPHITHLIYLPLPSHSSFPHRPWTSPFLLSPLLSLLLLPTPLSSPLFTSSSRTLSFWPDRPDSGKFRLQSELYILLFTAKNVWVLNPYQSSFTSFWDCCWFQ